MAKLDANSEFEKGRALSVPVVKVPRSVKEWLCIDRAYENGNFKIEPMTGEAMYDQSYMFEDINYVNKDTAKKDSTLLEIMTLLKSLDGPFKITLANEQRDLDSFVNEIFNPINGQEYPVIEKGIGKWINQKIDEGTRDIRKTMILTVTCRAHSLEEAEAYFATIDTTLSNIFRNLRSRIYKMSAEERMVLLSRMLRAGEECLPPARISPHDSGWKNQILPASIQSDTDYMVINNKQYISVLVGTAFGQSLSEDKVIHSLSDVLFPTYITIDMQRVPRTMYEEYFNETSKHAKKKKYPTLPLLREKIKAQIDTAEFTEDKRIIMEIVDSLEDYTTGVYDMFAHETNLDMNSRLIGFGLKNIDQEIWEPCMLTIMHFLSMRIDTNQETKQALHLIVDEAQVLCEKETTAAQLLYAIETYRKVGAIVTLAAQNITHVLENPSLRDMFSNCPFKVFFDQGGLDAANLAKIQEFSPTEFKALEENTEGCGVLVWRGNVYLMDARMSESNPLFASFDTNFHKQAEKKKKQEEADISKETFYL